MVATLFAIALILLFAAGAVALLMGDRTPFMTAFVVAMVVLLMWTAWNGGSAGDGCNGVLCRAVSSVVSEIPDQAVPAQTPLPPPPPEAVQFLSRLFGVPEAVIQSTLVYR